MSEKKRKVIYVKDLVIKAENVHFEAPHRPRRVDPFFGPRRREEVAEEAFEDKREDEVEAVEDFHDDHDHGHDHDHKDDDDDRRPFSWI